MPSKIRQRIHFEIFDPNDGKKIANQLSNHKYDLVIYQKDFFVGKKDITFLPIYSSGLSVIISKQNSLSHKTKLSISDIFKENIYIWNAKDPLPVIAHYKYQLNIKYPKLDFKNIDDETILEIYTASNQCVGIIPTALYDPYDRALNYIPLKDAPTFINGLAFRSSSAKETEFIQIKEILEKTMLIVKKEWERKTTKSKK